MFRCMLLKVKIKYVHVRLLPVAPLLCCNVVRQCGWSPAMNTTGHATRALGVTRHSGARKRCVDAD